jgi:hypothetical protein
MLEILEDMRILTILGGMHVTTGRCALRLRMEETAYSYGR